MSRPGRQLSLLLLPVLAVPPAAAAVEAHVAAASDYVFRGVSQSRGDPVVQAGAHFEHRSGWLAGAFASQVDFERDRGLDEPREIELDLYLGYGLELSPDWALVGTFVRYEYPGADTGHDYDYDEWTLTARRKGLALTFAWTERALGFAGEGLAAELTGRWRLPAKLELSAGVGRYDLRGAFVEDYLYGHAALARRLGRAVLRLGLYGADSDAERAFGDLASARLVGSVALRLRGGT